MTTRADILRMLSDGAFHSGTDLGRELGVTRAAICKNIHRLTQAGLDVHRITGRGYKLDAPLILLERSRILKHLGAAAADFRARLHVLDEVDSTNRYLAQSTIPGEQINGATCLAEAQRHGRGRRGRTWIATPYRNLILSMAWRFASGPNIISGLSLAAGVAVLQALEEYGVAKAQLKWPNDVLWDGRKLAGVLVDVQGEAAGPTLVILGVGVNGYISQIDARHIDQPWVGLQDILGETVDRNRLAALVIRHLFRMFQKFSEQGLAPFRAQWQSHHYYHGRRVRLIQGERQILGTVAGIDENGGLIIRHAKGKQVCHSGEISMRPND